MEHYVIHTNEDKEFLVRSQILSLYSDLLIRIPIKKTRVDIHGSYYYMFEKILPEYMIVSCKKMNSAMIRKIRAIYDVENFSGEKVEREEIDRFIRGINNESALALFDSGVKVVCGDYAGNSCSVISVKDDKALISLTRFNKTIQVPIWFLGKEIK